MFCALVDVVDVLAGSQFGVIGCLLEFHMGKVIYGKGLLVKVSDSALIHASEQVKDLKHSI